MTDREEVKWGLGQRFEFLEWRLFWTGRVNRRDLEDRFGVSTQQASLDLKAYQEAAPDNVEYSATEKAYRPLSTFKARFLNVSADHYLSQLDAILNGAVQVSDTWFSSPPPTTVAQNIARSVDPSILREILRAIEKQQEVDVLYQSLTGTRPRTIAPHAIAFDGHRWHARAWCVKNGEFRDFVFARMRSLDAARPSNSNPTDDMEWNTLAELVITTHPGLDAAQKSVIEQDFGMKDGILKIKSRLAMAFYFIRRLNLDLREDQIPPERRQIHLMNFDEIKKAGDAAKAETQLRVKMRRDMAN